MATTTEHMAARNDPDLLARFVAAAEQQNIPNAAEWVQSNMGRLVTVAVSDQQTISDVHAYASAVRQAHIDNTPERPGINLSAVTDTFLIAALTELLPAQD